MSGSPAWGACWAWGAQLTRSRWDLKACRVHVSTHATRVLGAQMLKCLVVHSHARRSCYRNTLQTHACRHLEGNFEASLIGNIFRLGPLAVHHDVLIPEAPVQILNARGLAGELLRHLPMCCRCWCRPFRFLPFVARMQESRNEKTDKPQETTNLPAGNGHRTWLRCCRTRARTRGR